MPAPAEGRDAGDALGGRGPRGPGRARAPRTTALKIRDGAGLTYAELQEQTNRLANALLGSGLEPGDRVGAWMEDRVDYPVVYVALAKAGLVVVPINTRYRAAEAAHCLQDSGARGLIFTDGVTATVEELADILEGMLLVSNDGSGPAGTRRLDDLLLAGADTTPPGPIRNRRSCSPTRAGRPEAPRGRS